MDAHSPDLHQTTAPYVGPRPFERHEAALFFGRDDDSETLISLTISHRAVLVYSASGIGKSSLLAAEIIPKLEQYGYFPFGPYRAKDPANKLTPLEALIRCICTDCDVEYGNHSDLVGLIEDLVEITIKSAHKRSPNQIEALQEDIPTFVIFVDQFEELFSEYSNETANASELFKAFSDALEASAPKSSKSGAGRLYDKCRIRFVLAMREDFIAKLEPFFDILPALRDVRFRLEPLNREAAIEAIKRPVERWQSASGIRGIRYEPGVAEQIVDQLSKSGISGDSFQRAQRIEPVQLQVVCLDLWNSLPRGIEEIRFRHIPEGWDVDSVLQRFYEQAISATSKLGPGRLWYSYVEYKIRKWFDQKLITPAGTRGMVFREGHTTGGIRNEIVDGLASRYLVRHEARAGGDWYEISHDRLVQPIQTSNRRWREKSFGLVTAVFAGLLMFVAGAGALVYTVGYFFPGVSQREVNSSVEAARARAPDVSVALAAVAFNSYSKWHLKADDTAAVLRNEIFDNPEISGYDRLPAGVKFVGNDIEGRPNAILTNGQIATFLLSGAEVAERIDVVPTECQKDGHELVATNGNVYLSRTNNGLSLCSKGQAEKRYDLTTFDAGKDSIVVAALHPLGTYYAFVSCTNKVCSDTKITLVDGSRQTPLWQVKLTGDHYVRDVSALAVGWGLVAVAGCADKRDADEGTVAKCTRSKVEIFDWDQRRKASFNLDTPAIQAIALSPTMIAVAYGSKYGPKGGRIILRRIEAMDMHGVPFALPDDERSWQAPGGDASTLAFGQGGQTLISTNSQGLAAVWRLDNVPFQGSELYNGLGQQGCTRGSECARLSGGFSLAVAQQSDEYVLGYTTFPINPGDATSLKLQSCLEVWSPREGSIGIDDWKCSNAPRNFTGYGWRIVRVSDDGNLIAASGFNGGGVWARKGGKFEMVSPGRIEGITAVAISRDAHVVALGKPEGKIELWSINSTSHVVESVEAEPLSYQCVKP